MVILLTAEYRVWSPEEKDTIKRRFIRYLEIAVDQLPGKAEIEKVMASEPALKDRTWRKIKDYIRNNQKKL